jgi:acyl-[acyl-carrier-protein]-phospholipid O-acyltransferase/long-chain-fatty-acid--[acyl-carrier-protein] ligase
MTGKTLARDFFRSFVASVIRCIYQVRALNTINVPAEGGVLMVSNHVTYVDAFMISLACPRPVRFVIVDHFLKVKFFAWFLRLFDTVPISPSRAKEAIRTAADAVAEGSVVCIFPEGQLTRTGMLNELKKGFELIAKLADRPVLPVYMDSLWGSIFSFERFRYFRKKPKHFPYPVTVNFGPIIPPRKVSGDVVRGAILDLSVEAFSTRGNLRFTLGQALIRSLARKGNDPHFVDLGRDLRSFGTRQIAGIAIALARKWRATWPAGESARTGILLPAGAVPVMLHAALILAGRVPVSLPLRLLEMTAAERDALLARLGIGRIITSRALVPAAAWPQDAIDFKEAITSLSLADQLSARAASTCLVPFWLDRIFKVHRLDPEAEAVAYVRDDLKLVSCSHRAVIASVEQLDSSLVVLPADTILIQSQFNSPAAQVFGLWHPLLERSRAVYRGPGAMKADLALLLQDRRPEIVLIDPAMQQELTTIPAEGWPTSVRVWLDFSPRPLDPHLAARLGAEGSSYCHGFAPDHLGFIVTMNTNDPNSMIPHHLPQIGNRPGTLGRILPGFSARLVQNGAEVSLFAEGSLEVRGGPLSPDWQPTGLTGSFDREGFFTPVAPVSA